MKSVTDEKSKEIQIHGDVLEAVISFVPLVDLLPVSHVSKSWNLAVSSSLCHFNTPKPWLLVHTQSTRSPYSTTTHAYDPRSLLWLKIDQTPINYVSPLRSSQSTLLYMLSPSRFLFSFDPLHLIWHHADAPLVWRTDPIVAAVGHRVIVAGGGSDFSDDPLAVEIYDLEKRTWDSCDSMPAALKDTLASTWLSVAVYKHELFVMEKHSGLTYSFDPVTKLWHGPNDLHPDEKIYFSAIGFCSDQLLMVGLIGSAENLKSVKIWKINVDSMECREVGEMPMEIVQKMSGGGSVSGVTMTTMGESVYIHNPLEPGQIVLCEVINGGCCRWETVRNAVIDDDGGIMMKRMVFTSSNVGVGLLHKAQRLHHWKYSR